MADPQTVSAAEFRKQNPEYDHSGSVQQMTAEEFTTGKRRWDRPLAGRELTDEVHGFMPRVIEAFKANGWIEFHTYDPRKCRAGFPDLVMASNDGWVVFAELKTDNTKKQPKAPDPEQVEWLDRLDKANEDVFLWCPSDWPAICAFLKHGEGWPLTYWSSRRELYVK